ncbi:hypothetical protein LINPERHAP2_LOCUS7903 [Linum perenne]
MAVKTRKQRRTLPPIRKIDGDDNLLIEILIRALPNHRSSCQCKLVCKNWNSVISNPYFSHRSIQLHQQPKLHKDDAELRKESILSFLPIPAEHRVRFRVLDRVKDLTLCGFSEDDETHPDELSRTYLVCNHTTNQWVALPPCPPRYDYRVWPDDEPVPDLVLDLDSSNRFQVFLVRPQSRTLYAFTSSNPTRWTTRVFQECISPVDPNPWKGKLYWFDWNCYQKVHEYNPFNRYETTVKYDVSAVAGRRRVRRVASGIVRVSKGVLHVSSLLETRNDDGGDSTAISVWRKESGDGDSWKMMYEVDTDELRWCEEYEKKMGLVMNAVVGQDPDEPELVYVEFVKKGCDCDCDCESVFVACNLRTRVTYRVMKGAWLEKRFSSDGWPAMATRIHNYEKLRAGYNGGCDYFVS